MLQPQHRQEQLARSESKTTDKCPVLKDKYSVTSNYQRLANAGEDDLYLFFFLVMKDLKAYVEKGCALQG